MYQKDRPVICPTCGQLIVENYCSRCGEKRLSAHDYNIRHFLAETLEGFTHFDNKFFISVKLLVTKPGLLTRIYFEGRRIPFMKPLQLFIVVNILFFFLLGKTNLFSLNFYNYLNFAPFNQLGTREMLASKHLSDNGVGILASAFNERMVTQSKSFLILFIPFIAIVCKLFFFNARKSFVEHFVFALHLFSFLLLYYIAFRYLAENPFAWISGTHYNPAFDAVGTLFNLLILCIYFFYASKRFFRVNNRQAFFRSLLFIVFFTLGVYAYRMFLFYKIMFFFHQAA